MLRRKSRFVDSIVAQRTSIDGIYLVTLPVSLLFASENFRLVAKRSVVLASLFGTAEMECKHKCKSLEQKLVGVDEQQLGFGDERSCSRIGDIEIPRRHEILDSAGLLWQITVM